MASLPRAYLRQAVVYSFVVLGNGMWNVPILALLRRRELDEKTDPASSRSLKKPVSG